MQFSPRQTLKRCLIAVAMAVAGMLAIQGTAQAAPSAAPEIVSHPADPNTEAASTFTYTVGAGETSVVSPLRYYCRIYNADAAPPGAGTGWTACGLSTDDQPSSTTYYQANGHWTFEVAARESAAIADQGPIASYTWNTNQAAPSEAPVIVSSPADPNTTSVLNKFEFGLDPAETETVTRFECRVDALTQWGFCSSNTPAGVTTGSATYNNLANGAHRVQVRATNMAGSGPVTTFAWVQQIGPPTEPPVIQSQPADPVTTTTQSIFKSVIDPADLNITAVSTMQCRLDDGAWSNCISGSNVGYYPTNGDHTFQVRASGPGGQGPIASVDWTVDVPQVLNDTINVDDVAMTRWDGPNLNSRLGQLALGGPLSLAAGDVNGDGSPDLAIGDDATFGGSLQILFSSTTGLGARNMTHLGPKKGFRILDPYGSNRAPGVASIGDQNGDGRGDLLVGPAGDSGRYELYVVYGVDDASSFPGCGNGVDRCLDLVNMAADQGYKLTSSASDILSFAGVDFDGDGVKDIVVTTTALTEFILKGSERSGTVNLDSSVGTDAIKVLGPAGTQFGFIVTPLKDVNGDGKDEFAFLGGLFAGSGEYVVTGRSLEGVSDPIDLATMEPDDGFYIALAPLGLPGVKNVGDMNGDGRDDLMVGYTSLASGTTGEVSIVYMPELPTSDPILAGNDLEEGQGYMFLPGSAAAGLGMFAEPLGDIDGDGLGDQLLGAGATPVNAFDQSGAIYVVKGQQPGVESPINVGPEFNSDLGVPIVSGKARQGGFGGMLTVLGDIDGDGLPDFATAASGESNNGVASSGSVYIIPGKSLFARSVTGGSTVVDDTKAAINGQVGTNGRATDYHFEYGTSEDYGSSTESQSLAAGGSESVSSDLSGLTPDTEYHYRLVVTNDLGFNRIGEDKTFTTAKTPPPQGCDADNTAPGCPGWDRCKDDSTQPGCPDYNYCKENASKPECQAPKAKLSGLIVSSAASKVKRGKKTTAKATIVNTGTAAANGVKVCLSAPKKLVGGAKCVSVGKLGAGATKTVKFKVTVKKKAKKGKKVVLKFKATAKGLGSKTGKVKIKVG